ncbi:MAG: 2Fe-2S iron-sulfur cluster-binding protein [Rhodobacteraceae bacterium]|nr:2Fe-2S iron-sulfur cluster-binding protein [Paracoccaceae bacterium]
MSGFRIPERGSIDKNSPLSFQLDNRVYTGFKGDTVASALLASGERVFGRSFKLHRPRGIWGMGNEEPNIFLDATRNGKTTPNLRATLIPLTDNLVLKSSNSWPNARKDWLGSLDLLRKFVPPGFYYKTFIQPNWLFWEPLIRRLAGIGHLDPENHPMNMTAKITHHCPLLVVGGGAAGLAAAEAAADDGIPVWLIDEGVELGGSLQWRGNAPFDMPWREWVDRVSSKILSAGGRILNNTVVWGVFDHHHFAAWEKRRSGPDRFWRLRSEKVILATGAIERPLWFINNDLPGIMSAEAAYHYLEKFGVVPGKKIVIATGNDYSYILAGKFVEAGSSVTLLDARDYPQEMPPEGVDLLTSEQVMEVQGSKQIELIKTVNRKFEADTLLVSGGFTPSVHLWMQAGGKLKWDSKSDALIAENNLQHVATAGAANGKFDFMDVLADGYRAGGGKNIEEMLPGNGKIHFLYPFRPNRTGSDRIWVDCFNDVTLADVENVFDEGYSEVEHLKRYTTLGMAADQGKTSNLAGIFLLSDLSGEPIEAIGTTTFRPPYVPIPLTTISGQRHGAKFNPLKRLELEPFHRDIGADFREYGGWLRPSKYVEGDGIEAARTEAKIAREKVVLFDASPLGKIEVIGPDAGKLLDYCFYIRVSNLKSGKIRYNFMLTEGGIILDDGIVLKLDDNRYIVSASSSHVEVIRLNLEEARQDRFGDSILAVHDTTHNWATLTAAGPMAAEVLKLSGLPDYSRIDAMPHMSVIETGSCDLHYRIARVSFTGEQSYEISVPAGHVGHLLEQVYPVVINMGGAFIGVEASALLRAEKGYILVGKDTDGSTMPQDLGISGPMHRRKDEFLGKRSLFSIEGKRTDRRQLVGIKVDHDHPVLPTGAHLVPAKGPRRSLGFITSSYFSPNLNQPIALALCENGLARMGQGIGIFNRDKVHQGKICSPCFFDIDGERLNG